MVHFGERRGGRGQQGRGWIGRRRTWKGFERGNREFASSSPLQLISRCASSRAFAKSYVAFLVEDRREMRYIADTIERRSSGESEIVMNARKRRQRIGDIFSFCFRKIVQILLVMKSNLEYLSLGKIVTDD